MASPSSAKAAQYWLMKSEPDVYSLENLKREKRTLWTGVRNYQARNYMMGTDEIPGGPKKTAAALAAPSMKPGDFFLFYHSNAEPPGCVGVGRIERVGVPDPDQFDKKSEYFEAKASKTKPIWFSAEVSFSSAFKRIVTLDEIRGEKNLENMMLLQKGSRLSVQPLLAKEFDHIVKLGNDSK